MALWRFLLLGISGLLLLQVRPTLSLHLPHQRTLDAPSSRRNALTAMVAGAATLPFALLDFSAQASTSTTTDRDQLLSAIGRGASDEEVLGIIEGLKDPSEGKGAVFPDRLDGVWELVWSYKAEAFSPLLKLPRPFRPSSYQYLGSAASGEVGEGRIAQGLTGGVLGNSELWLSSGSIPFAEDSSVLEIQPPFRFQLGGRYGSGIAKKTIVDAGSDTDFRALNARSKEAQLAPKNQYKQIYLENDGPGSIRVSSVIAGDPVIVGDVFVHRKL